MIDPKLQAELRARYNPDDSEFRKYQLYLLQMLKDFDKICEEIGVRYWLSSGTLIGAARHGGFIPWDDDIDVEMLKEDYEKLLRSFKETEKYAIQSHDNDTFFFQPFAKFRDKRSIFTENQECQKYYKYNGIFIDILKMNWTNRKVSKLLFSIIRIVSKPLRCKRKFHHSVICASKNLINIVFNIIPYIDKLFSRSKGLSFGHEYGSYFYDYKRDYSTLFPLKKALFEDYYFPVPNDVDGYLTATYGDWNKLPDFENLHVHLVDVKYL